MADPYLLLTPILALGVLALVRFIGCDLVFGLDLRPPVLDPPVDVTAVPGDRRVDLAWFYSPMVAASFTVTYGTDPGGPYPNSVTVAAGPGALHSAAVTELANGTQHFFKVAGEAADGSDIEDSVEVSATPNPISFVVSRVLGPERNNFEGFVGMAIIVGALGVRVSRLGRIVAPGNVRGHVVKIVDVGAGDADLASVTVQMPAGPIGEFAYVSLAQPVDLLPLRRYHIVSHEEAGGDRWYDLPTSVSTTTVASVLSAVFSDDAAPAYVLFGSAGQTYVPVDFQS